MTAASRTLRDTLAKLQHLDRSDLVSAGVLDENDERNWTVFRDDPLRGVLRLADDRLDLLTALLAA